MCFFDFTGVSRELGVVITSAVRMAPRLVRFSVHATRWNFGEAECSRGRFLVMVEDSKGEGKQSMKAVVEVMVVNKRLPNLEEFTTHHSLIIGFAKY